MAKFGRTQAPQMTRGEIIAGFVYWPIYLLALSPLLLLLLHLLGAKATDVQLNLCYFITNFLVVAVLFRRYLIDSLGQFGRSFWHCIQAIVLGLAFYYLLSWAVSALLLVLDLPVQVPNDEVVQGLVSQQQTAMMVCTVLLAPLAEEVLNRGLIFGNLVRKNRLVAYLLSTLVFSLLHVFAYLGQLGLGGALLTMLAYAPAGIALAWTFEKAGTIWAPIVVHGCVNYIATGLMATL